MRVTEETPALIPDGLFSIEGEFFTQHLTVRGELTTVERRLSDHLNGATATFELRPSQVQLSTTGSRVKVDGSSAYMTKAHLLLIVPVREPSDPSPDLHSEKIPTTTHTCWIGLGRYSVVGRLHTDARHDRRLFMRAIEHRQFVPLTEVRVTFPDGMLRECPAVLVNRRHIELLAVQSDTALPDYDIQTGSAPGDQS